MHPARYWIAAISLILAVIGAINWALVGLFDFNLVTAIFGVNTAATRTVYVIVGLAGLAILILSPLWYEESPTVSRRVPSSM
jgi:uncharacterized protein